eukprot:525421-Rhodomonas_salina.1
MGGMRGTELAMCGTETAYGGQIYPYLPKEHIGTDLYKQQVAPLSAYAPPTLHAYAHPTRCPVLT